MALELSHEDFIQYNQDQNEPLLKYVEKASKEGQPPKYSLPESDRIYYKDFHFLEEPLIERQHKKEEQKKAKKLADSQQAKTNKEESKIAPLPMFSNQKDDAKQDRNLSKLRVATNTVDKSDQSSLSTPSSNQPTHSSD